MVFNVKFLEQFTKLYFNKISLLGFSFEEGTTIEMGGQPYATAKYYLTSHEKRYELIASSVLRAPNDVKVGIEIKQVKQYEIPEQGMYRILKNNEKQEIYFEYVDLADMLDKYKVPLSYMARGRALDCGLFGITIECETPNFAGIFDEDEYFKKVSKAQLKNILDKY